MANELTIYWGTQHIITVDMTYEGKDIRDYTTTFLLKRQKEDHDDDAILTVELTAQDADTAKETLTPLQTRITPAKYFYKIKIEEIVGDDEQTLVSSTCEIKAA